jgi:two-component system, OmpR family, response regulator
LGLEVESSGTYTKELAAGVCASIGPFVRWGNDIRNESALGVTAPRSLASGLPIFHLAQVFQAWVAKAKSNLRSRHARRSPPLRRAIASSTAAPHRSLSARKPPERTSGLMKILLVEDDPDTAAYVSKGLSESGHVVEVARDGRDGLFLAAGESHDVVILDRMLPKMDGIAIIKTMRAAGIRTPVLFLTTLDGINDRVEGLEAGGDDYLIKPFAFAELIARVSALNRRPPMVPVQTILKVADLEMDLTRRTVTRAGRRIDLQPREFKLLEYLVRHAGHVVTRTMLLENIWDFHFDPRTTIVETHISRLRGKVDRDFGVELIQTVRGAGYCIRDPS